MSAILAKQGRFLVAQAKLVLYVQSQGKVLTGGELWRSDEQAIVNSLGTEGRAQVAELVRPRFPGLAAALENNAKGVTGIVATLHGLRLAFDGILFRLDGAGELVLAPAADYEPLGAFWKALDPDACWGGDFAKPDVYHFSFQHGGVK